MSGKIILGIDPGTTIMGYGIISVKGENVSLIDFDDFSLKKLDNHYLKLKKIFSSLSLIIEKYNPDEIAIEAPFFGKNVFRECRHGKSKILGFLQIQANSMQLFSEILGACCHADEFLGRHEDCHSKKVPKSEVAKTASHRGLCSSKS